MQLQNKASLVFWHNRPRVALLLCVFINVTHKVMNKSVKGDVKMMKSSEKANVSK